MIDPEFFPQSHEGLEPDTAPFDDEKDLEKDLLNGIKTLNYSLESTHVPDYEQYVFTIDDSLSDIVFPLEVSEFIRRHGPLSAVIVDYINHGKDNGINYEIVIHCTDDEGVKATFTMDRPYFFDPKALHYNKQDTVTVRRPDSQDLSYEGINAVETGDLKKFLASIAFEQYDEDYAIYDKHDWHSNDKFIYNIAHLRDASDNTFNCNEYTFDDPSTGPLGHIRVMYDDRELIGLQAELITGSDFEVSDDGELWSEMTSLNVTINLSRDNQRIIMEQVKVLDGQIMRRRLDPIVDEADYLTMLDFIKKQTSMPIS